MFNAKLGFVGDMLILAAAAPAEIRTQGLDAIGRGLKDAHEFCAGEVLFDLGQFGFNFFADEDEGNEHDKIIHPGDAFAAKSNVIDCKNYFLADLHERGKIEGGAGGQKSFRWEPAELRGVVSILRGALARSAGAISLRRNLFENPARLCGCDWRYFVCCQIPTGRLGLAHDSSLPRRA
jgi:hypothetical protein